MGDRFCEYILKPHWVEFKKLLNVSENIRLFNEKMNVAIEEEAFDLNLLRKYYFIDKNRAIDLIDELVIRGFKFFSDKPSTLLPSLDFDLPVICIRSNKNNNHFIKINFAALGLGNIVERFDISSDEFFDGMPIQAFRYLNKAVNLRLIQAIFIENEFDIIEVENYIENDRKDFVIENNEDLVISDVYRDGIFNNFRQYCSENEMIYIKDLSAFDFNILNAIRGFGVTRVRKIQKRYGKIINGEYISSFYKLNEPENNVAEFLIHEDFQAINIERAFQGNVLELLKINNIEFIGDLNNFNSNQFYDIPKMGKARVNNLIYKIKTFEDSFDDYIKNFFESLPKKEGYDIYRKRVLKKVTLEQLGQENNVTRERIRQKEGKIVLTIGKFLAIIEAVLINKEYFQDKTIIGFDELVTIFNSYENAILIKNYIIKNNLIHISYFKEIDSFLVNMDTNIIRQKLNDIVESMGDMFNFYDKMVEIEERLRENALEFIDVFVFEDYVNRIGYKKIKDYYSKVNPTDECLCSFILERHFHSGMQCIPQNIQKIRDFIESEYGIKEFLKKSDRTIWAKIERNPAAILWGKSTRIHINNISISDYMILKIKETIDNSLLKNDAVSADFIFNYLQSYLTRESDIVDKFALYGVIQYYFKDVYSFKKLMIKRLDAEKLNSQEILEKIILESGGKISISEIKSRLQFTETMINAAINFNRNILSWENGSQLIHVSTLNLNDDFKENLLEKIKNSFIDGYANSYMILKNATVLLMKNGITDPVSVFSLAKYLYSDYFFFSRRPHILLQKPNEQFTTKKLILKLFNKYTEVSYHQIKNTLIDEYAFNELMLGTLWANTKNEIFQIHIDTYVHLNDVFISQDTINLLNNKIKSLFNNRVYITLDEFDYLMLQNNSIKIKDREIPCNKYIVKSVIETYLKDQYRTIMRKCADFKFDKTIIVESSSEYFSLEDIMLEAVINEYNDRDNMTIVNIQQFLIDRGIIYKKIPEEFFKLECVSIDEFSRVYIQGR